MSARHFVQQPYIVEPRVGQRLSGRRRRTPYLHGIEPCRANGRYPDQALKLGPGAGEYGFGGGARGFRAQLSSMTTERPSAARSSPQQIAESLLVPHPRNDT